MEQAAREEGRKREKTGAKDEKEGMDDVYAVKRRAYGPQKDAGASRLRRESC